MSDLVSNLIVGIAIAASACYAVWHLGPRTFKMALRARLAKLLPGVLPQDAAIAASGCAACNRCAFANPQLHTISQRPREPECQHSSVDGERV